jgi:hypothetical protein
MTELEKIACAVIIASRKLRHYFEEHKVRVTSNWGLGDLLRNSEASARIAKWAAELSSYNITFEPRTPIKTQVLADFIVDWIGPSEPQQLRVKTIWTIHCDGVWCHAGAGAAAIITSPTGLKYRYVTRLYFALESDKCTNNIAEYEAVIIGLRKLRDKPRNQHKRYFIIFRGSKYKYVINTLISNLEIILGTNIKVH